MSHDGEPLYLQIFPHTANSSLHHSIASLILSTSIKWGKFSPMFFCRLQLAAFSCSGSWMPGNGLPPSLPKKRLIKTEERPLSVQYVFPFSATVAEFVHEVIWVKVQNIHSNTFTWRDLFVKESAVWKAPGLRMDCACGAFQTLGAIGHMPDLLGSLQPAEYQGKGGQGRETNILQLWQLVEN